MQRTETVLLLGDSLVEFFDWQARFPEMTMSNRGVAGERVRGLLARLADELAAAGRVEVVVIMIGANNLAGGDMPFYGTTRRSCTGCARPCPGRASP
ncbi:MAG: hypothetical protein AB1461_19320 [Thermodesulfobacteriota bacterium]